ncbi:uncharacterized protein LOC118815053 [Colossoma macropomum]|uniref:uncharacterized protein LOC118815053 n=1 Tax=Colossoma macropomum TaxID=42526 RepID=UPI001864CDA7|nr:uncharacterized protein LOC118815053 [Colossoma macropomum]
MAQLQIIGDSHHLFELRIVLLGDRYAGKSSTGNTILNREEFELKRTAQCVKRQREVAGRHITVVEAPGWWSNKPVEESTELLKQEIVLSVSLCPPGPHAVLMLIRLDSVFKENKEKMLYGFLGLLTDRVWSHTIVLFTCGDCLGDTPIEQHIESEGKELQWLVEKCGNRYHVLNNKNRSDDTQVTELLEKIEKMVAANSGRHFEMDREILQEVEEKRRAEEERAKERMTKVQKQNEHIRTWIGDAHHLSELRIVLLGYRYAGKSSAGNTILNREEFELKGTAQCVKRQREVAGRHITVVEAPGWWIHKPVEESTELLKQEIVLSVSLCPPGPHAVLLIMDCIFKKYIDKILDGYLELLTDKVWRHTIVMFTFGDCLGDTPIEQHIESEGKELQWLVEKCGNRYHVLNNKNRSDDTQVTEVLEKIEEMVAANSGRHFELDRKILQEVEEKRRAKEERAKERMMKVQKQREHIRSWMGDSHCLSELRIVLLGDRYAGKSSAGNTILNREEFELKRASQCVKRQREVAGRHITVVEAPGWWSNKPVEMSTELLKQEIVLSVSLCPPGPHALLLILRADCVFKKNKKKMINGYLELLTDAVWSHTIVLFTCGDRLGSIPIEQHIESEGKELQWLVEKCGNRYHVLNNENRSDDTQVTELLEKIEEMVAANSGRHFEMDREILQEVEEKRRAKEERAKERMMKVQKPRGNIRSWMVTEDERSEAWSLASSGYISMSGSDSSSVYGSSRASSYESLTHDPKHMRRPRYGMPKKISSLLPLFSWKKRLSNPGGSTMENRSKSEPNYYSEKALSRDRVSSFDLLVEDCSSASAPHSYTEQLSMATVRFIPEIVENNSEVKNTNLYRFQCPHTGQFQCRLTNLVFEMEGKGEVLYRIDFWDTRLLDGLGQMEPAGPLYNIDCFEGSISHLHLPHCEIQHEEDQAELVVAHFTGENIEVIQPLRVTNTHVIISIQDLSLFGLLKKILPPGPISAQVLLFYKEMMCKEIRKKLHIHLLPGNVPVEEVEKKHKVVTYFETSSTCQLIAGRKYKPSCDPHVSEPKVARFVRDYGPNYHPTFVVFFQAEDITVSILDEDGVEVWEPHQIFLTSEKPGQSTEANPLNMETEAEFVDEHRQKLIQRVPSVMEIVDCLKCKNMITAEMYSSMQTAKMSQEQMRILYRALDSGGTAVKAEFYKILQKIQPFLVDELEAGPSQKTTAALQRLCFSLTDNTDNLSELRIVLLGYRYAGKSSAGNTILNREEFELKRTAQCVKRQREVAGRHITVVEAPGWWRSSAVAELLEEEIVLSVSLCPPGPHALLLVLRVDRTLNLNNRKIFEGHLKLLSERVWRHTIVLFTYGDLLRDTPIEQHIESEGKELQWLVEKCGNRYHVLNNENRSDDTQVTELLEKIEEMVAANGGRHFEMDRKILQKVEKKRRAEEERALLPMGGQEQNGEMIRFAKRRLGASYASRKGEQQRSSVCDFCVLHEICWKHFGATSLKSPTTMEAASSTCLQEMIRYSKSREQKDLMKCTFLLITPSTVHHKTYTSPFNRPGEVFCSVCTVHREPHGLDDGCFHHSELKIVLLDIESEGKELQWLVEKCGNRYHVLNNENRSDDTQVTELLENIKSNSEMHYQRLEYTNETNRLSELRIVLLGCLEAGKSSAGNTILGREEFDSQRTAQCVKRQREVAGRHITVVEAPGWWSNNLVEESTEFRKQEIVLSVSLCPPGPHAVLLVIPLGIQFTENDRTALQKHLKLLTESVWSHTLVLFTCGDCLGDTPIEQHIKSEGRALQWLVEICGNRYHVLNNEKRSDHTQVTELLEKIEEMAAANSGRHFEMDREILEEVEEKKKVEEDRAKERMMKVQKQRKDIQAKMGDKHHISELRIVLLGYRYAGKSSAGNTILKREKFELKRTAQCVKRQRKVARRHITVVEAPGWWRNVRVEGSDEQIKQEIVLSVSLCPPGPHCLLLVIRVDSKLKTKQRKALEGHLELLADTVWSHTIVLFTFGGRLGDTPIEQHIESEGNALQCLIEKCGNRYHVLNNENKNDITQVTELLEKIEEMVAGNNGYHFEMGKNFMEMSGPAENLRTNKQITPKQRKRKSKSTTISDAEFVDKHREQLIQRVSSVKEIADHLMGKMTNEIYNNIVTATPHQQQMRMLYVQVLNPGGATVKAEFYRILKIKQPYIVEDLEARPAGH